jgi:hypothetical protein
MSWVMSVFLQLTDSHQLEEFCGEPSWTNSSSFGSKEEKSLVRPRPCLFSQEELIQERAARNAFDRRPGITGLAQVQVPSV